jgi:hypothetical protein
MKMLRTLARSAALTVLAYSTFVLLGTAMMLMPFTPHGRMLRGSQVLNSFRDCTDCEAASAAFDEWLRVGHQAQIVEATVLPIAAGLAVVLVSRFVTPLSLLEVLLVTAGFAIGQALRAGTVRIDVLSVLGAVVFGATLCVHTLWLTRHRPYLPKAS